MNVQLKRVLVQSQVQVVVQMLRTAGAVARSVGESIERLIYGITGTVEMVTENWVRTEMIREAQRNQVAGLGEASWRSLVGEQAWEAFRKACAKMRASTVEPTRSMPTKEELEDLFSAIFSSTKGRERAEAEDAKPEAPAAS